MNLKPIKSVLRRFVPAPIAFVDRKYKQLDKKMSGILAANERLSLKATDAEDRLDAVASETATRISHAEARLAGRLQASEADATVRLKEAEKRIVDSVDETLTPRISALTPHIVESVGETLTPRLVEAVSDALTPRIEAMLSETRELLAENQRTAEETLWSQIFNSTVVGSSWFSNVPLSPGRWAVGYPYLYVLYRALDETNPRGILDLGLGQSTKMIASYVAAHPDSKHTVVEHDSDWIGFFKEHTDLTPSTELVHLPLHETAFLDDPAVTTYDGFADRLAGRKFGLISIDGPFGYKANHYSRVDTVSLLPDCLEDSFVILTDDFDRPGERATVDAIKRVLEDSSIPFRSGVYSGKKQLSILTSEDLGFLCSM